MTDLIKEVRYFEDKLLMSFPDDFVAEGEYCDVINRDSLQTNGNTLMFQYQAKNGTVPLGLEIATARITANPILLLNTINRLRSMEQTHDVAYFTLLLRNYVSA